MDFLHNRRTPLFIALILGLSLGTVGCSEKEGTDGKAAEEEQGEVLATVNGEAITEGDLKEYSEARPGQGQNKEMLLDELVTRKVVYQDAVKQKLDQDPEVKRELEQMRTRVLMSALVRKAMKDMPVTDEELHAEYDKLKGRMAAPEYKASHILVKEEGKAKEIVKQLDQGANFAELAKQHSTDSSGKSGGDLGWFNPQQMVPPFSQALAKLEKGSYTKEPVKTQFGWHIIKLEDSRSPEPPAFEEVKGRIEPMLQQRKVREYIEGLKEKAEISIKGKEEEKKEEEVGAKEDEKADNAAAAPADAAAAEKSGDSTKEVEKETAGSAEETGDSSKTEKTDAPSAN